MITLLRITLVAMILVSPLDAQAIRPARADGILCSQNRSLGPDPRLIVDLALTSDRRYPPPEKDLQAVTAAGGRVLHAFNVSVLRAELDTATLRRFLGPDSIATVAYPVQDTTRLDVSVQIFLRQPPTPADDSVLPSIGVRERAVARRSLMMWTTVADSAIPKIASLASVAKVQAISMLCMTVDVRDLVLPATR